MLEDTKIYQDAAVEYQSAFYSIQDKYSEQACLLEEASRDLLAAEGKALRRNCDTDIQQAVGRVVSQYQTQLNAAQLCTHEHQVMIQQLHEQVKTLKLSLASQADLPSVGQTQGEVDLWEEIFNILPGTVNMTCGTAMYNSPDQPFLFQKHV